MSASVAKIEHETLSDTQRELHEPVSHLEPTSSVFHRVHRKFLYHSDITCRMEAHQNDVNIKFSTVGGFDHLLWSYRIQQLPALRVKSAVADKFRICWPKNMAYNTIKEAKLLMNEDSVNTLDSVTEDIHTQFNLKAGFLTHEEYSNGSVPELTQWTKTLPEFTLLACDPWAYAVDSSFAIPLYFCGLIKVVHSYTIRNNIKDLLRMQELKGELWVDVPCNFNFIEGQGEGLLKAPELWGNYSMMTEEERKMNMEFFMDPIDEDGNVIEPLNPLPVDKRERVFYYNDYVKASSLNPSKLGEKISAELESTNPVKCLYWVVENLTATKNRNYSNYTTNASDITKGRCPIETVTYTYSTSDRLKDVDVVHFQKAQPYFHAVSPPRDPGYCMYSYAINPQSLDVQSGVTLTGLKARLTVTLRDNDPYDKFEDHYSDEKKKELKRVKAELEQPADLFHLHVRMLVTRRLSFTYIKDSNPYSYKFQVR